MISRDTKLATEKDSDEWVDLLFRNRAEHSFQRTVSRHEDFDYLQEIKVSPNAIGVCLALKKCSLIGQKSSNSGSSLDSCSPFVGEIVKAVRSTITPVGAYHVSLKFGPLLVESRVEKRKVKDTTFTTHRGILMSHRFSPNLLGNRTSSVPLLYEPSDRIELEDSRKRVCLETCCKLYLVKDNKGRYKTRRIEIDRWPSEEKASLACMKTVYGAAFSGYPDWRNIGERATVDALVNEARSFYRTSALFKDIEAQRQALRDAANCVLTKLQATIGNEVDKHLSRFVEVFLDPNTNITWNATSNNCQKLVDKLLQGKDFEYFFPRLPKQMESRVHTVPSVPWPRYLMSFNDRIAGDSINFHQPRSVLTKFFLEQHFGGDLVDFLEARTEDNDEAQSYETLLLRHGALGSCTGLPATYDALWEMPRDTLSILQFHICRGRARYVSTARLIPDHRAWIENRLLLLLFSDIVGSLSGALGSALLGLFIRRPDLISRIVMPKARVLGTVRVGEQLRIVQPRLSTIDIVYVITARNEEDSENCFEALDEEANILTYTWEAIDSIFSKVFNSKRFFKKWLALSSPIPRGFSRCEYEMVGLGLDALINDFISILASQLRKRDNWVHLGFRVPGGTVSLVMQLCKKSKNTREGMVTSA
jgi:hypothetical protein